MSLGWKRMNDMVEAITSPMSSAAGDCWEIRVLPCQYLTWKCWVWLWAKAPDRLVVGECGLEACILLLQILLLFPVYGSIPFKPDILNLILLVVIWITHEAPWGIFLEMCTCLARSPFPSCFPCFPHQGHDEDCIKSCKPLRHKAIKLQGQTRHNCQCGSKHWALVILGCDEYFILASMPLIQYEICHNSNVKPFAPVVF